eukprot:a175108_334.p1 GENE.a175108_334~~a175108_334.p1  ORF type:complete len:539 (+),score=228.10 a175108_334:40-1617(+)
MGKGRGKGAAGEQFIDQTPKTFGEKMKAYMVNEGQRTLWLILYLIANFVVFFVTYARYKNKPVYKTLGEGVTVARGAAAMLNLNCALLLLPVSRNLMTGLRRTFLHALIPLDDNIEFHKFCAWTIALSTSFHGCAHYFNYWTLGRLIKDETSASIAFGSIAGVSGHIIVFCMVIMYTTALERVRRQTFELFWYTHHLFIVFFGALTIHGSRSVLQPNQFWAWFILPGFIYCLERATRVYRGNIETQIVRIVQHPSNVLELQLAKGGFQYKSGAYLFINCPMVAKYEYHPFTITSAPAEEIVSIHMRVVGDWTGKLASLLGVSWDRSGAPIYNPEASSGESLRFRLDGPFGAASEDVFNFEVSILVGCGIGVTPFASILKNLWFRVQDVQNMRLRKVYFVWIARDKSTFEWFSDIIAALEQENLGDFLDVRVYLTAKLDINEVREIMYVEEGGGQDAITGLRSPTFYGRPRFDALYDEVRRAFPGIKVGVFLCGPKVVADNLRYLANQFNEPGPNATKFIFQKENF